MRSPVALLREATMRRVIAGGAVLFAVAMLGSLIGFLRFTASVRTDLDRETNAVLAQQAIADRILRHVHRQLLDAARYLDTPQPELVVSFRGHGARAYEAVREYLFHDLSLTERLQVERVKELHQEFEVAAQRTFDLRDPGESVPTDGQVTALFDQVSDLEEALDRFIGMRRESRAALRDRETQAWERLYVGASLLAVALATALLLFLQFVGRRLLEPLAQLSEAAKRLRRGDLEARIAYGHWDELWEVAESFNQMADSLAASQRELERRNETLTEMLTRLESSEADLRRSEARLRSIFDEVPVGLYYSLADGTLQEVNPALVSMLGYPDKKALLAVQADDLYVNPEQRRRWKELIDAEGVVDGLEVELRRFDGKPIRVLDSATALRDEHGGVHYEGAIEDVTQRRLLEEKLRQSQKMEAVGRLAGGVAHDFNNLLTVIDGYTEVLLESLTQDDSGRSELEEIHKAAQRAISLTSQLLAFSRKQVLRPRVVDLEAIVADTRKLLRRLIGEDIELVTDLTPGPSRVKADPGQLAQVLLNLAVNARDAMPEGGRLAIATRVVDLDGTQSRPLEPLQPGRYVVLSVSDTGQGMDENTMEHVFEPFFTTKGPGKGTGLGLSTVYGIVRQSGGHLRVDSEVGRGTTFEIHLPEVSGETPAVGESASLQEAAPGGTETVLLVEDEPAVRELARRVLAERGYSVLVAGDGAEALRLLEERDGHIDLLLTDLVMPEIGGRRLRDLVLADRPSVKVLFISGYSEDEIFHRGVAESKIDLLEKPFSAELLLRSVRRVLDS